MNNNSPKFANCAAYFLCIAALAFASASSASAATNNKGLQIVPAIVKNKTGMDAQLYIAIQGQTNIGAEGWTFYAATGANGNVQSYNTSSTAVDISYAVTLKANGTAKFYVPQMQSSRIYFSFHSPITVPVNKTSFTYNQGGVQKTGTYYAIGGPSGWTTTDPNYTTPFDWVEYNWAPGSGSQTVYINTTQVDMFGLPIQMSVTYSSNAKKNSKTTVGAKRNTWQEVFAAFDMAGTPWTDLIVTPHGHSLENLRIVAPGHAIDTPPFNFPADQMAGYISQVYAFYEKKMMTITTGGQTYTGTSNGSVLTFTPGGTTITMPTTLQLYSSDTSVASPASTPLFPFVAAGLLRTSLLVDTTPSDCDTSNFYENDPIDVYATTFHQNAVNGLAYAMPYDDNCDQSSTVVVAADQGQTLKKLRFVLQPMTMED